VKFVRSMAAVFIGLIVTLAVTSHSAAAQATAPQIVTNAGKSANVTSTLTYAWVVTANVQVYANPGDSANGIAAVRSLGAGFLYVSLADARPIVQGDQTWYLINAGEYVNAKDIAIVRPTKFQGITLPTTPDKPFGWMVYAAKPTMTAGGAMAADAKSITRYTPITVLEEQKVGDLTWYRVGDKQWVDQKKVALIVPHARPDGVGQTDKWIDVNTFEQTLAAYEGDRMVFATLISSGLPQWATDPGLFRVYAKVKMAKMSGREGLADYYFLEDVPYATYFKK